MAPCPLLARRPTTRNGSLRMRMVSPTGSAPAPNRLSRTTVPITATFAARDTSAAPKKLPLVTGHDRIAGKSTSVPWMEVDQFWFPATTCARVFTCDATYRTPGTSRRMACASASVSVVVLPVPDRAPPCTNDPDMIMIRFVPAELICDSTDARAPFPIDTMLMTAATPMIIPRAVSAVRSLLRASAVRATRSVMKIDISLLHSRRQGAEFVGGAPLRVIDLVGDDTAVAERDDAAGGGGGVRVVRGEDGRGAAPPPPPPGEVPHPPACPPIEG